MFFPRHDRYDPVEAERESRRPFFQRQQTQVIIAFVLWVLIWFVAALLGVHVPLPFEHGL